MEGFKETEDQECGTSGISDVLEPVPPYCRAPGRSKAADLKNIHTEDLPPPCESNIYCTGDILHHVQLAKIFTDDKHFVDMGLLYAPAEVISKFQDLLKNPPIDRSKIIEFVNTTFAPPGTEFEEWSPQDWHKSPQFLNHITDSELRSWAADLHDLWKSLGRKISQNVKNQPDRHSQIYVPNPVIVPGGRFIEFYYWDSYWVINGLLLSEMYDTARGMIENFLYMVDSYGFIPNGGRVYYLNRSQPPFLTLMMESYMATRNDETFLRNNISILEKEYDFWMTKRSISVTQNGKNYTLNRYYVPAGGPRPESYSKDYELAENLAADAKQLLYSELKAAAESGWDFSSRWFYGSTNSLLDTKTNEVIPVDLNAILCRVERALAKFYTDLGMTDKASKFSSALDQRLEAVQAVLWDEGLGIWLDYYIKDARRNQNFYPSNLAPLWASCYTDSAVVDKAVSYLEKSKALSYQNGLPTSLKETGQQWDFPNAWPPLQHMVIEGLEKTESKKAKEIAFSLAQKWVKVNYDAYKKYKAMFEKYNVEGDGKPGGGGEYEVQMTGLDIKKDQIIEMACLITDSDLNLLAEGPNLIIKQPDELLDGMSNWCKEHHGKSGLTQAVRDSKISLAQAEYEFLSFVRKHTPPGICPLAGNSVHVDKVFLNKYMPQFMRHLHYRIIDVSSVKELCRRWYPADYERAPMKAASHRALDDIRESIKELHFYRQHVFKKV